MEKYDKTIPSLWLGAPHGGNSEVPYIVYPDKRSEYFSELRNDWFSTTTAISLNSCIEDSNATFVGYL